LIFFAENGFEVYAFDLSESALEKLAEQIKKKNNPSKNRWKYNLENRRM